MTILTVLNYPDPKLARIANKVSDFTPGIRQLIEDMFETLYHLEHCAALAATQLDIPDPPCITVIDLSQTKNEPLCLVNPIITHRAGTQTNYEGCMSVYPTYIRDNVTRANRITVQALDRHGLPQELTAEGYLAQCIQHECEHLDGKLYLHLLSPVKRARLNAKINKVIKKLKKQ